VEEVNQSPAGNDVGARRAAPGVYAAMQAEGGGGLHGRQRGHPELLRIAYVRCSRHGAKLHSSQPAAVPAVHNHARAAS